VPAASTPNDYVHTVTPVVLLPGIIQPAALRYAPLIAALGDRVRAVTKELEVYAEPRASHRIADEVEGIDRFLDQLGAERAHLYGHSGGGACALAYVAVHPERVATLAVDEPAADFTPACRADPLWPEMRAALALPPDAQLARFIELQLADGVAPPPPSPGPRPPWFASRPAGITTFVGSVLDHAVEPERYASFERPVLLSIGGSSSSFWERMAARLGGLFPTFRLERFPEANHLQTSHQIDPVGVARMLVEFWR